MTINPRQFTDRYNRLWTWADEFGGYRHDNGVTTRLADLEDIGREAGPLTAPDGEGSVDDPDVVAQRWLELKAKTTPPGNVFEWCWEHGRAVHLARLVLLHLAFHADDSSPTVWPGYASLAVELDVDVHEVHLSVLFLTADLFYGPPGHGELFISAADGDLGVVALLDARSDVLYSFPTYQKWLAEQAITDPELAAAKTALDSWRAT